MRLATIERIAKNIAAMTDEVEAHEATLDLYKRVKAIIVKNKGMLAYAETQLSAGSGPKVDANGQAHFLLQYWNVMSPSYATSLTFVLEDGRLQSFARLLHLKDAAGTASSNIQVQKHNGVPLEEEVKFFSVEGLVKACLTRTLEFRIQMLNGLGFQVGKPMLKKLNKSVLNFTTVEL